MKKKWHKKSQGSYVAFMRKKNEPENHCRGKVQFKVHIAHFLVIVSSRTTLT